MLTKLSKEDFGSILENYDIGNYREHKYLFTGGNTVFKIKTTKGEFILKIFEHAKLKFIEIQNKLSDFLAKNGVAVAKIMHTISGNGIYIYKNKKIVIQEFINGKEMEKINAKIAKDMGTKLGKLGKILLKYPSKNIHWNGKIHFEVMNCGAKYWKIDNIDLRRESLKMVKECNQLNRNKLKKCVLHGDICESNFLIQNNKLKAIIDWDDYQQNYLVFEIAVFVGHVLTEEKRVRTDLIQIFFKQYQKQIKLNNEELKAVYLFAKKRILDGAIWSINLVIKHPSKKKEVHKWARTAWKKYTNLNNLTLDKFMGLVR